MNVGWPIAEDFARSLIDGAWEDGIKQPVYPLIAEVICASHGIGGEVGIAENAIDVTQTPTADLANESSTDFPTFWNVSRSVLAMEHWQPM